jgi:hypothetical protein
MPAGRLIGALAAECSEAGKLRVVRVINGHNARLLFIRKARDAR